MTEIKDNFTPLNNITPIREGNTLKTSVPGQFSGIIESEIMKEGRYMSNDTYTKNEIDLKFDKINSDVKHGFEKVDLKFDQLKTEIQYGFESTGIRMEKMFSDFKIEQQKEKEENKKWLIALTVGSLLSIIGIVISIIAILLQK